jgi:hypothetical protein
MVGLDERSRAPKTVTCRTEEAVERLIVLERRLHPTWGAKKIQRVLSVKHGIELPPVISTVGEVLKRHGMVKVRRRCGMNRGHRLHIDRGHRLQMIMGICPGMNRGHRLHIDRGHRLQIIMDICPGKTCHLWNKNNNLSVC